MDLLDTLPDVRYWAKILHCTIPTPLCDLEVDVMDLEILWMIDHMLPVGQYDLYFKF